MATATSAPADTARKGRLIGVDAARGLALIGMMSVHIITAEDPVTGELTPAYLIASGRSSALFAVLAGVGLALAYGGTQPVRGRDHARAAVSIVARAIALILVGMILGGLDSGVAVILVYYGVLFVVAIPFLRFGPQVLLPLAAAWAIVVPIISHASRTELPPPSLASMSADSLSDLPTMARELLLTGYYPVLPWTAYILAGLGIGRLALASTRTAIPLLAGGALLAATTWLTSWLLLQSGGFDRLVDAGLGGHLVNRDFTDGVLTSSYYGTSPTTTWWWLTIASPHTATPFDLLHTIGTSAAVLGMMLLLAKVIRALIWPLAAIGSMTFTLYTLHVVLLATVLPDTTDNALLIHVVIAFAVAMPWRAVFRRGPLEAMTAVWSRAARELVPSKPS